MAKLSIYYCLSLKSAHLQPNTLKWVILGKGHQLKRETTKDNFATWNATEELKYATERKFCALLGYTFETIYFLCS